MGGAAGALNLYGGNGGYSGGSNIGGAVNITGGVGANGSPAGAVVIVGGAAQYEYRRSSFTDIRCGGKYIRRFRCTHNRLRRRHQYCRYRQCFWGYHNTDSRGWHYYLYYHCWQRWFDLHPWRRRWP